jgi:23S rRNA (cytidine1920-2'-O)/16S rRNA (cytidine1409-2'-O)-methyltransferase
VVVRERINARHLQPGDLPEPAELVTVDVSFISLLKVVPALLPLMAPGALLLTLIKPQFEAGRHQIGKGGIVRSEEIRRAVIDARAAELAALGLEPRGLVDCELKGMEGNQEAFAFFRLTAGLLPAGGAAP